MIVATELTSAQQHLLEHLIAGTKPSVIARELGLTAGSITNRTATLFRRLKVSNLVELGAWAQRNGYFDSLGRRSC